MNLTSKQFEELNKSLPSLDNRQWQTVFDWLRSKTEPRTDKRFNMKRYSFEKTSYTYTGESEYFRYMLFINDILSTIRSGKTDYCFKVEHVVDLLKFEHDRLQTEWIPSESYFKVFICI